MNKSVIMIGGVLVAILAMYKLGHSHQAAPTAVANVSVGGVNALTKPPKPQDAVTAHHQANAAYQLPSVQTQYARSFPQPSDRRFSRLSPSCAMGECYQCRMKGGLLVREGRAAEAEALCAICRKHCP